jgi:hypothetical protein
MSIRNIFVQATLGAVLFAPMAAAQSASPTITAGQLIPLTLKSETPTENVVSGSFDVGASYDDNVLFGSANRIGDWSYVFRPRFRISRSTSRLSFTFHVSPWLVKFQRIDARDEFTTDSGFDMNYKFTPHFSMRFREAFIYTDHVDLGTEAPESSTASGAGTPNLLDPGAGAIFVPFARRVSSLSDLALVDQLSPQSEIQLSGDYYILRLRTDANVSAFPFVNTESAGARALYFYRITPRQSIGAMYDFQDYSFEQEHSSRNLVHTLFYVHAIQLAEKQTLEGFVGPQYSNATNGGSATGPGGSGSPFPTGSNTRTTWAGGLAYGWQGVNTKLRAAVLRDIGAGEGVLGAVERTEGTVEARRQLTNRWIGSVGVGYEKNTSLFSTSAIGTLSSFFATAGVIYKINDSWKVEGQYHRNQQSRSGTINSLLAGDRDEVEFTVGYQFRRPLGR